MKISFILMPAIAILICLTSASAGAQERGVQPSLHLYAVNPSMSLGAPANNPLQEQMRQDYATSLMNAQRELLQQNPSGSTRQERAIEQQLNGYVPQ